MKFFLDTAVIDEIRTVHSWGVLDGVTTNPTLFAKAGGGTYEEVLKEIAGITGGALESNEGELGPIMLQGDHGPVAYRNIWIKPIRLDD